MGKSYDGKDGTKFTKDAPERDRPNGVYRAQDGTEIDTRGRKRGGKGCLVILTAVAVPTALGVCYLFA